MMNSLLMRLFVIVALTAALAAAKAENPSYSDVQFLYGGGFRDDINGSSTASGAMNTVTLEHGGSWAYGTTTSSSTSRTASSSMRPARTPK